MRLGNNSRVIQGLGIINNLGDTNPQHNHLHNQLLNPEPLPNNQYNQHNQLGDTTKIETGCVENLISIKSPPPTTNEGKTDYVSSTGYVVDPQTPTQSDKQAHNQLDESGSQESSTGYAGLSGACSQLSNPYPDRQATT